MKKYHIITFGCQMNVSDSERITSILESIGYKKTPLISEANLIVANMCSVRQSAVDRIFGVINNFKKNHPVKSPAKSGGVPSRHSGTKQFNRARTLLTGCILEKDRKVFEKEFDYVIDIKDITKLPEILNPTFSVKVSDRTLLRKNDYFKIKPKFSDFIAYVPIMTGCNNFCAYCVVPYVRGSEVSRPVKDIISEVKSALRSGAKEIWLLGQNVNSYKFQISNLKFKNNFKIQISKKMEKATDFPKLLKMVNDISGDFWIKFTSSHPKDFSDNLTKTMKKSKKVAKYLNLPVQTGDDKILKKMNRSYTIKHYKKIINKVRKAMPDIAISTDIIVGFPSESKKQFENAIKLFKELKFDMAYINQYSPRKGTAAYKMKESVSKKEKDKRDKILNEVLKNTAFESNKKLVGKTIKVLVLEQKKDFYVGKTEGNKTVKIEGQECKIGNFENVKVLEALPWGIRSKTF